MDALIAEARATGVTRFIMGGTDPSEWERQDELAARYPGAILPVYGIHPWWISKKLAEGRGSDVHQALEFLESRLDRAAGLGELGLDQSRHASVESLPLQKELFEAQLRLAVERDLPLMLHVVKSHSSVLEALDRIGVPRRGGIVHGFTSSLELAREYLKRGLKISFGSARPAMLGLGPEDFTIESDLPPCRILAVASEMANLRRDRMETAEFILARSTENLEKIFNL